MKRFLALAAPLLLSGCAKESLPEYPSHPTALVRTHLQNLGFKGFFASESTHTVHTRANMRRAEDEFRFSGMVMSHLAKSHDEAVIARLDKSLLWRLNVKDKSYEECPLLGCKTPAPAAQPQEAKREPERPKRKPSCQLKLAKNSFSVKPTGKSKEVNGFQSKEYQVAWNVLLEDKDKNKDASLVSVEVWTAPEDEPRIAAVRAVERKFGEAYRAKMAEDERKIIPAEAMKILAAQFLDGLSSDQRAALTDAMKELGKIRGYPVYTKLEWRLDLAACPEAKPAPGRKAESGSSHIDMSHGLGAFLGSAAGAAAQKGVEHQLEVASEKPVFGYVSELQAMQIEPASDGLFLVPPGYTKVNR